MSDWNKKQFWALPDVLVHAWNKEAAEIAEIEAEDERLPNIGYQRLARHERPSYEKAYKIAVQRKAPRKRVRTEDSDSEDSKPPSPKRAAVANTSIDSEETRKRSGTGSKTTNLRTVTSQMKKSVLVFVGEGPEGKPELWYALQHGKGTRPYSVQWLVQEEDGTYSVEYHVEKLRKDHIPDGVLKNVTFDHTEVLGKSGKVVRNKGKTTLHGFTKDHEKIASEVLAKAEMNHHDSCGSESDA